MNPMQSWATVALLVCLAFAATVVIVDLTSRIAARQERKEARRG